MGQGNVFTRVDRSLHGGGVCLATMPWESRPPVPGYYYGIRSTSGRYAFYWNGYLLEVKENETMF